MPLVLVFRRLDNCNADSRPPEDRFPVMTAALNASGRPILFSLCEWGVDNPGAWAQSE
jgi:alpha-galactosidase